eukprot:3235573-Pleurochrysis_carterae.AAC.2
MSHVVSTSSLFPTIAASSCGHEGCRSRAESPMPCDSRVAFDARAADPMASVVASCELSSSATSAARFPNAGSSFRWRAGTRGTAEISFLLARK